jgi:hypothetical protein
MPRRVPHDVEREVSERRGATWTVRHKLPSFGSRNSGEARCHCVNDEYAKEGTPQRGERGE